MARRSHRRICRKANGQIKRCGGKKRRSRRSRRSRR